MLTSLLLRIGRDPSQWNSFLDVLLPALGFVLVGIPAVHRALASPMVVRRWAGLAPAWELGMLRAGICGIAFVCLASEDMASLAGVPAELRQPMGVSLVIARLPAFLLEWLHSSVGLLTVQWLGLGCLAVAAVGYRTQAFLIPGLVLYLLAACFPREVTHYYHSGLGVFYLLCVLSLTRCGDGFSVDRMLGSQRAESGLSGRARFEHYGFARFFLWGMLAFPYAAAGVTKLRDSGLAWASSQNIRTILIHDAVNSPGLDLPIEGGLQAAPAILFAIVGLVVLLGECGYAVVLFSRHARAVLPWLMLAMHGGVAVFQGFLFLDFVLLQALFGGFAGLLPFGEQIGRGRRRRIGLVLARGERRAVSGRLGAPVILGLAGRLQGRLSLAASMFLGVHFALTILRLNVFPMSQWSLYSQDISDSPRRFVRVVARDRSQRELGNVFHHCLPVFARDGRYRDLFPTAFDPAREHLFRDWLRLCAVDYDQAHRPEEGLAAVELELREFKPGTKEAIGEEMGEVLASFSHRFDEGT